MPALLDAIPSASALLDRFPTSAHRELLAAAYRSLVADMSTLHALLAALNAASDLLGREFISTLQDEILVALGGNPSGLPHTPQAAALRLAARALALALAAEILRTPPLPAPERRAARAALAATLAAPLALAEEALALLSSPAELPVLASLCAEHDTEDPRPLARCARDLLAS